MLAVTLLSAHAQNTLLYGTSNDWQAFDNNGNSAGYTVQAVGNFSYGNITVNGLGDTNASAVGATGIAGALQVSPAVPSGWPPPNYSFAGVVAALGGQSTAFFQAIDGQLGSTGSLVSQSGTMIVDFTMPDHSNGGTHFTMAIFLNYAGGWGWTDATSQRDLGPVSTPSGTQEMYEAVIPYNLAACTLYYWEIGPFADTDYQGVNPWYITSWSVVPIPPSIIPAPVYSLFCTSNDFALPTGDSSFLVQADGTWSETNDFVTNGLGNTSSPGGAGLVGSLLVTWNPNIGTNSIWGPIVDLPNENGNWEFLNAIDPGWNWGDLLPAYGNVYIDFTYPDTTGGGSYFQLGISFSYPNSWNEWSPFFSSKTEDLGYQDLNGDELTRATIPYAIPTDSGTYPWQFSPYIFANSDYHPANPFHIANITVSSAPAPAITSISPHGTSLVISGTGGLTGDSYTVFTTTNLALPFSQWTVVGTAGAPFNGPTFSVTNTVPAGPATFYEVMAAP